MLLGKTQKAKRLEGFPTEIEGSSICYRKSADHGWFIYLPGCGAGRLAKHKVVEHEDGTITVTRSILMHGHRDGSPATRQGYLTRGVWTEV